MPESPPRPHTQHRPEGYAPYDLTINTAAFELVTTTVVSKLGSCVARHRVEKTSDHATVFLHGASGCWTTWTPLLQSATATGSVIENPVLLDLPGWGEATIGFDRGDDALGAIGELVLRLLTELGYTRFTLVGHSLGGFIALHLAALWPQRVTRVLLISGTTFSVIRSVNHPVRNFTEVPGFTMLWRVLQFLAVFGDAGRALVRALGPTALMRLVFSPLFRHGHRVPRSVLIATAHDLRPRSFAAAAEITRGYDAREIWSAVICPVVAIKGDRDVFVTDADLSELRGLLRQTRTAVLADCGHFGIVERPADVLRALGFSAVQQTPGV